MKSSSSVEKIKPKIDELNRNHRLTVIHSLFSKRKGGVLQSGKLRFEEYLGLKGEIKRSDGFEIAILNLMSILGFEVIFSGTGLDAQGVDVIALAPEFQGVFIQLLHLLLAKLLD